MRRLLPLLLVCCACTLVQAQTERVGMFRIQVTVTPRQLPADGKSQARVRVEVKDLRGRPAPQNTQVVAHTDLGLLSLGSTGRQSSLTVQTSGGFAIFYATSPEAGTATISVQVADSRTLAYVDFLPEGEVAAPEARVVDVAGGWVGYNIELAMIEARDRARIKFGRLVIECGSVMQIDIENLTLKAQDVIIRRGDTQLAGEDLFFDLATKRGVLRRFGDEHLERVFFDSLGLRPLDTEWELPSDAFRMDRRETDSWLVAKSISFFPHEKIVLRHASLWVQEQRVFSFPPFWIIGLPGYTGATNSQAFGVTSSGGLALDFPFFYRVTDRATGAIRIQHGARAGSVIARDGWSLALSEEYRDGNGVEGKFELAGLPRRDWGFEWNDSRPMFGDGFGYFSFSMPDHRSIFTDANAYDYLAGGRINLRAYYDAPVDYGESYGLVGDWLMDPRSLGAGPLSYRVGTSVGMRQYSDEPDPVFVNELYSELDFGARALTKRTTLSPLLTNIYSWDTGGFSENSLRGELRLDHQFGEECAVGLDWATEWRQGGLREGVGHILGFDLRASHGRKWMTYLSSTYDLTDHELYGYMGFDYYFDSLWRGGVNATYYDLSDSPYQDLEFSIGRAIGSREISLIYSTDTGRISLSLGGFGFN